MKFDKAKKAKYNQKASCSFKTKLEIYLFEKVINQTLDIEPPCQDFEAYIISEEAVNMYSTEYWQELHEHKIKGITVQEIEKKISKWKQTNKGKIIQLRKHYVAVCFSKIFSENDFNILLENTSCFYCKITIEQIKTLANKRKLYKKNFRGWTLEIDRLNSNYEYSMKNCVMACYWCNNAKTDEFSKEEFTLIGDAIAQVWKARNSS